MEQYNETEYTGYPETVSGNEGGKEETPAVPGQETAALEAVIEVLNNNQSYGTIGDYYSHTIGCYIFPDFAVYEYFIDIDADGAAWTEASDGHYVPVIYWERYEETLSGDEEPEEPEPSDGETLQAVQELLATSGEEQSRYCGQLLVLQEQLVETDEEICEQARTQTYLLSCMAILLALLSGVFMAHVFWGRMRAG